MILDLEETCAQYEQIEPQEIIEISAVAVNATTGNIVSEFHCLVQPRINKSLSEYCIQTSGISQADIDAGYSFEEALDNFDDWFRYLKIKSGEVSFAFVTSGDRDLMTLLPRQAEAYGAKIPDYFSSWVNLKKAFEQAYAVPGTDLLGMLKVLQIYHVGKQHGGIDACRNVARIVSRMVWDGKPLELTFQFGVPYQPAPRATRPKTKLSVPQIC